MLRISHFSDQILAATSVGTATAMVRAAAMRTAAVRMSATSKRGVWRGRQEKYHSGGEQEFQEGGFTHGFHRPCVWADQIFERTFC